MINLLSNVPIFEDFLSEELQTVTSLFKERTYRKGSIIFFEGDTGDELFIIKSGFVKVYRLEQTKEITLALFRDGDFFGEMSLIEKNATRSATAETIETCTLYSLSRADFTKYMESHPNLCLRLLEVTMKRLRKANEQIHDLTFLDVRSRIIKAIVTLSKDYGTPVKQGTLIDMKLTHQEIANIVGTVRESVTKVLQELQDNDLVSIDKKKIIVSDLSNLSKLIQY